ncbi:MAG: DUF1173 family protein [Mesorhizobium sp.]|nr:MAG: DUF1173 family protein [Mesorhizobium sp.]TIP87833.1 MAG: DUF1173 domain-containing protein [Mesorhizobium sp.]
MKLASPGRLSKTLIFLPADRPTVAALLHGQPRATALYIVPPMRDPSYAEPLEELIASRSEIDAWMWRIAD